MRRARSRAAFAVVVAACAVMACGLAAPSAHGRPDDQDDVAAVRSWVETPPGVIEGISFVEKAVYRMGDRIALEIVQGFSDDEILDPSRVERVLAIVRLSFSQPRFITRERDRVPLETDLLLSYLEWRERDGTLRESIGATERYVTLATSDDALRNEVAATMWSVQTAATAAERTQAAEHLFELTKNGWSDRIDDETMMTFASLLDGACDPVRYWVARCLGNFGLRARPTAPKLEQVLAEVDGLEGDKTSASGIRFALSQMGIDVPEAD